MGQLVTLDQTYEDDNEVDLDLIGCVYVLRLWKETCSGRDII